MPAAVTRLAFALFVLGSLFGGRFVLADTVFVTLERDNALAVVDGVTGQVTKTVRIGKRPRGIVLSPDGASLFVAVSDEHTIKQVDRETLRVIARLPSGNDPETFAIAPDGKTLYVSNEDDNRVTVVDVTRKRAVKEIAVGIEPEGIAVSPDGRWVVSTSETTNLAHWIDTQTFAIVDNSLLDPRPRYAAFDAGGARLWISSEIAGTVSVFDSATRQPVVSLGFKVPGVTPEKIQPVGIKIDRSGQFAYVALGPANRVAVIDVKAMRVVDYWLVGQRVWNLEFSPDQKRLYTANGLSNDLSIIDLEQRRVAKSVAVGNAPWGIAVAP